MELPMQRVVPTWANVVFAATVSCVIAGGGIAESAVNPDAPSSASEILKESAVQGGLVVHLGCGEGQLTSALCAGDGFLVHGLDADAGNVEHARQHVQTLQLKGKVTFEQFSGDRLPYVDNLVNLLVAEELGDVSMEEVLRVLAPGGVACLNRGQTWTKTVKPRPDDIDEWTHFLHGANGNAVAADTQVGPPRHIQWMAAPTWTRNHHTLSSISAVVSAQGRVFYIADEATAASMEVPGQWFLVARDAFNGMLLWKRPISSWAWTQKGFRSGPVQLPRTLVAEKDRVYAPLRISSPVSAVDAATGKLIRTYDDTDAAEEVLLDDGVLLVVTGSGIAEQAMVDPARQEFASFPNQKSVVAVRADSGELLWRWTQSPGAELMPLTLAAADGRVFFQAGSDVVCLERESGEQRWRATVGAGPSEAGAPIKPRKAGWSVATLCVVDGTVLVANDKQLSALSAATGDALWNCECKTGFCSPVDVLVVGGVVWLGPDFSIGRDLATGKTVKTNTVVENLWTAGHHHRCYREKATERYLLTGKRGIEFVDLVGDNHSRNNWVRGTCQYGVMPSNGLIYAPSHACGCFMEAKLWGFWALAPERSSDFQQQNPLDQGPVYEQVRRPQAAGNRQRADEWPTYRNDPTRCGSATAKIGLPLEPVWKTEVGGRLSAPVVAEGLVVACSIDAHRVIALDAHDGTARWSFIAGGRVDSPPTVYRGLVLFGSADGWVYCLRASDGQLAWRFRAAPQELKTLALDQLESVWPVHGSVLVDDGVAYAAAGRSTYLDGGIFLFGLDPATGRVACSSRVRRGHPGAFDPSSAGDAAEIEPQKITQNAVDAKTFVEPDRSDAFSMDGTTNDVLVSDGTSIYLRNLRFDRLCAEQESKGRHLLSTSRLLDDAEVHRSHWVLGTGDFSRTPIAYSWIANSRKPRTTANIAVPCGLMLAFDENTVWGVARYQGYKLFAESNRPFSADEKPLPDFRFIEDEPLSAWEWSVELAMRPRAMLRAGDVLVLGSMPLPEDPAQLAAAFEGKMGGLLTVFSAADGGKLAEHKLDSPPVWDGIAVAGGKVYLTTADGRIVCLGKRS
jgi:outer membrane protein assembly factor BamB